MNPKESVKNRRKAGGGISARRISEKTRSKEKRTITETRDRWEKEDQEGDTELDKKKMLV